MSLNLIHLDNRTRNLMIREVENDIDNNTLYISPRLNPLGKIHYQDLLIESIRTYDDEWLAEALHGNSYMNSQELSHSGKGRPFAKKIPSDAPFTLAEGEFNRFYIRGLCQRAIEDGFEYVIICRVKEARIPRPDSQTKIGRAINAKMLLDDLRTHPGVETALGLPSGANSGLSVMLP